MIVVFKFMFCSLFFLYLYDVMRSCARFSYSTAGQAFNAEQALATHLYSLDLVNTFHELAGASFPLEMAFQ